MPVPSKNEVVQEPKGLLQLQGSMIPSPRHQRRDRKDAVEGEKEGRSWAGGRGQGLCCPHRQSWSTLLQAFPPPCVSWFTSCLGTLPSHGSETPRGPELCFRCQRIPAGEGSSGHFSPSPPPPPPSTLRAPQGSPSPQAFCISWAWHPVCAP